MLFENIEKNFIKIILAFLLGMICLIIATIFRFIENTAIARYYSEYTNLSITLNNSDEKQSYILVDEFINLGIHDDKGNSYYIVYSNDLSYIVLMSDKNYKTLKKSNYKKQHVRAFGKTKKLDTYLRDKLINSYNNMYSELEENKIDVSFFNELFGSNYLDVANSKKVGIMSDNDIVKKPRIIFIVFLSTAIILFTYVFLEGKKKLNYY